MRSACVRSCCALLLAASACLAGTAHAQQPPAAPASAQVPRPLPKELPLKREVAPTEQGSSWAALFILLGLAGAAAVFALRRRGAAGLLKAWQGGRSVPGIERVASQPLTPHASVHAVRWNGEELLLGCTSTQVTVLARRPSPAEEVRTP